MLMWENSEHIGARGSGHHHQGGHDHGDHHHGQVGVVRRVERQPPQEAWRRLRRGQKVAGATDDRSDVRGLPTGTKVTRAKNVTKAGFFFVRPRKKLKGAKTQENGNSRKKLKLKEKIPFSGIF